MKKIVGGVLTTILLIAGLAGIVGGFTLKRQVYEQATDDGFDLSAFGLGDLAPFQEIREMDLVIDSTFTGVERREGKLYSTYDRTAKRGKQLCPT